MSDHERQHLCRMLNQIAANFAFEPDARQAAAAVANHVNRFWSAEMRALVKQAATEPGHALDDIARSALALVNTPD